MRCTACFYASTSTIARSSFVFSLSAYLEMQQTLLPICMKEGLVGLKILTFLEIYLKSFPVYFTLFLHLQGVHFQQDFQPRSAISKWRPGGRALALAKAASELSSK